MKREGEKGREGKKKKQGGKFVCMCVHVCGCGYVSLNDTFPRPQILLTLMRKGTNVFLTKDSNILSPSLSIPYSGENFCFRGNGI